MKKGEAINYDGAQVRDGYVWVHYKGFSGDDLFLPVRPVNKAAWGEFK
ncbi:SH3 domain-containing protein [Vagococcus carniphilus]